MRTHKFEILQMIPVSRKFYLSRLEPAVPIGEKITKKDIKKLEKVKEPILALCLVKTTVMEGDKIIREFTGVAPLNIKTANGDELTLESFLKVDEYAGYEGENRLLSSAQFWDNLMERQESARLLKENEIFKDFVADKKEESKLKK